MIRVTLDRAAVGAGPDAALPPMTAGFGPGAPTLLATEGGTRPTVLSLVASGRMKVDAGSVTAIDGEGRALTPKQLRRAVALIDTPLVAEHSDDVRVATVMREELALAGVRRRSRGPRPDPRTTRRPFGSLSGPERLELLIELALRRPEIEGLIITSPQRHGGEPADWWRVARATAGRGVAVLVVTDHATVAHLNALPQPEPVGHDALPLFSL